MSESVCQKSYTREGEKAANPDGSHVSGYDVNYGVSGIFQIYSWSIAFVVGGDHQISVYMVCIFKCKSLYQKMHFNQS